MRYLALSLQLPPSDPCYERPKDFLRSFGIQDQLPRRSIHLFLSVTALLGLLAVFAKPELEYFGFTRTEVIVAIWASGVLLLGYQQWHQARYEISMDKYYERLEIANRKRELGGMVVHRMMHTEEACNRDSLKKHMLVFSELDNLEYVIEKYKLGYMKPEQACRGLRTFLHRCRSEEFMQLAEQRVAQGDYGEDTKRVVERVAANVRLKGLSSKRPGSVDASSGGPRFLDLAIGAVLLRLFSVRRARAFR